LEFVNIPDDMAAILYSKSSTGRRGVEHLHAGYGDPGWNNSQWTWEIHNVAPWPIKLEAGKPLMQQVMIRMTEAPLRNYAVTGRYNGQVGPTPERPKV
jgi:deoxycytidine triphosphate deaminase